MSGTHGSRITPGGYQGPATDSASLQRGRAARSQRWVIGTVEVTLEVVPLEGGRDRLFEVSLLTNDRLAGRSVYVPCMLRGVELAEEGFRRTAEALDSGEIPSRVLLPAGAPLGW